MALNTTKTRICQGHAKCGINAKNIANVTAKVFTDEVINYYNMNNVNILDEAITAENPYNINIIKQLIIYTMLGFVLAAGTLIVLSK